MQIYMFLYIYIFTVVIPCSLGRHFALWVTALEDETKIDRRSIEGFSAVKLNYKQWLKWILKCLSLKGECSRLSNIWYDNASRHFLRWNKLCLLFYLFREEQNLYCFGDFLHQFPSVFTGALKNHCQCTIISCIPKKSH